MKNIPKTIYLNIGCDAADVKDFNELEEVTWNKERVNADDIPYQLKSEWHDLRINPNDVPEHPKDELTSMDVLVHVSSSNIEGRGDYYLIAVYDYSRRLWMGITRTCVSDPSLYCIYDNVLAWKDLPKFDKV